MKQYHDLLRHIMDKGVDRSDRTGTGTRSVFGHQMRFDLQQGFPLLTTKKVFLKGIIHELLRFLSGETNIKYLAENGVHIRDERPYDSYIKAGSPLGEMEQKEFITKIVEDNDFSQKRGELGPVYGYQRRNFNGEGVDQISKVQQSLRDNPYSRRILVVAYNPAQADTMLLPPCHSLFQFYVADGKLSCQLYQRSADVFLGVPFNIASYALLTMMMAQVTGLQPGEFVHTLGDTHLYSNHFDQVREQLSRDFRPLPTMSINPDVNDIFGFSYDDFTLEGYDPHPRIKAPIAV